MEKSDCLLLTDSVVMSGFYKILLENYYDKN